jgi:hypothetical protein
LMRVRMAAYITLSFKNSNIVVFMKMVSKCIPRDTTSYNGYFQSFAFIMERR